MIKGNIYLKYIFKDKTVYKMYFKPGQQPD